jgi:hypothetical protein
MRSLDPLRLGNQVYNEGMVLFNGGWPRHPASLMWRGYRSALARYVLAGVDVLQERGSSDVTYLRAKLKPVAEKDPAQPNWLGQRAFHRSHKSNLLRKDPRWYRQFRWDCGSELPYIWPASDRAHKAEFY